MALRMVKLIRDPKSGSWKSRKVIPQDVRGAYGKVNETPTWAATLTPGQAKAAWSAWLAGVEARIDRLRRIEAAEPTTLSHKEVQALAGRWYTDLIRQHEDNPGNAQTWDHLLEEL